jgi:hypothetical protein
MESAFPRTLNCSVTKELNAISGFSTSLVLASSGTSELSSRIIEAK